MRRLTWIAGPIPESGATSGAIFVSATRFTYRQYWHMAPVLWHGLNLRSEWSAIDGAVGIFNGASILDRSTYTLSAWTSETHLRRWLGSPRHAALMRDYKRRLASVAAVSWLTESFERESAWREAMVRLGVSRGVARAPAHR